MFRSVLFVAMAVLSISHARAASSKIKLKAADAAAMVDLLEKIGVPKKGTVKTTYQVKDAVCSAFAQHGEGPSFLCTFRKPKTVVVAQESEALHDLLVLVGVEATNRPGSRDLEVQEIHCERVHQPKASTSCELKVKKLEAPFPGGLSVGNS